LILDEVLGVMRDFGRSALIGFSVFRGAGKMVLLVSHVMDNMRKFCSRLLLVHNGAILEDGVPNDGY
jgi:ABC-type polysaccharide/polyol phosphate transport system ATPase subunit